jgi:hypothetical protein
LQRQHQRKQQLKNQPLKKEADPQEPRIKNNG